MTNLLTAFAEKGTVSSRKDCNGGMYRRYCTYYLHLFSCTNKFNILEDQKAEIVQTETVRTRYSKCPIMIFSAYQS